MSETPKSDYDQLEIDTISLDSTLAVPEVAPDFRESIADRLIEEPGLRYQIRGALGTFSIEPTKDLGLGYTRFPAMKIENFCSIFDLNIDNFDKRRIESAFLEGAEEFRTDMDHVFGRQGGEKLSDLSTFTELPASLQSLIAFKTIERNNPGRVFNNIHERARLKAYFTNRLGVEESKAEDVLQSSAIIHSREILKYAVRALHESGADLNASGVNIEDLVGPRNPNMGIHIGADLEEAVSQASEGLFILNRPEYYPGPSYQDSDDNEQRGRMERVLQILENATTITDIPESERSLYQSYLFAKSAFTFYFMPREEFGYDGSLGQLAYWKTPLDDRKYPQELETVKKWLEIAESQHDMNGDGMDLAKQAFALELVEQLEWGLVHDPEKQRRGQVKVTAKLLSDLEKTNPELGKKVLDDSPSLKSVLKRAMNPWGYKYQS